MKYRLAKLQQGQNIWFQIQKKTWFGWIIINEPGQKRSFTNFDEAIVEYENFLGSKDKTIVSTMQEDEV